MSDAERERKWQKIFDIFYVAAENANAGFDGNLAVDFPGEDSIRITARFKHQGAPLLLMFIVDEDGNIRGDAEKSVIAGIPDLFDDRVEDVVANLIKNELARASE